MKKTLLTIMATVCVMGTLFGAVINGVNTNHMKQIDELTTTYEAKIDRLEEVNVKLDNKNINLNAELDELEYQVYRMMKGDAYKVTVCNPEDGTIHTWMSESKTNLNLQ